MRKLQQVCKQLEKIESIRSIVDSYRYYGEICEEIITYKDFERVMMADGFILAESTVKQKWKLLVNNGILKILPSGSALFKIEPFARIMEYTSLSDEKKIKIKISEGGTAPITEGSE